MIRSCFKMVPPVAAGLLTIVNASGSLVNTGIDADNNGRDDNWTLVSVTPPNAQAFIALPDTAFPFAPNGPWIANDATSRWITYSTSFLDRSTGGQVFDYQLVFTSVAETRGVRWLSDNESSLYLDGVLIGTRPTPIGGYDNSTFTTWNDYVPLTLTAGMHTLDIVVINDVANNDTNPTGVRFEVDSVVPEPTTLVAGVLLFLPFGASTLRMVRRKLAA